MNTLVSKTLAGFKPGKIQTHRNMTLVPIMFTAKKRGPDYVTMKEALDGGFFVVTEVSEGGSVPNLKVANKGDVAVLLLDGEEVAGAKQNRVLNTTILVKAKSEVVIPVSCTEHGRWSYESREFHDSGILMDTNLRTLNRQNVNISMASNMGPRSNQSEVWDSIHMMASRAGVQSETGAMRDVYEKRKDEMDAYLKAFTCLPSQKGLMIFIGGRVVGFDYLSKGSAFAGLFPKLVKSYAMEAWLESRDKKKEEGAEAGKDAAKDADAIAGAVAMDAAQVKAFIADAAKCGEKSYDSVGLGKDYRYNGFKIVGSALAVDDTVIHMAFFRMTENEKAGNMAGSNRRRSFRL